MYSDLLDVLGSQGAGAGSTSNRANSESNKHIAVEFKAGKMKMNLQPDTGKYLVTPDTKRGSIRLVYNTSENKLKFEWYDRREKQVVDNIEIKDSVESTFERVDTGKENDRVYLWEQKITGETEPKRSMYWMQDGTDELDDENVAKVNQYLSNPSEANPASSDSAATGGTSGAANTSTTTNALDADTLMQVMQGVTSNTSAAGGASGGATATTSGSGGSQIDALSNILENLGMPQPSTSATGGSGTTATTPGATTSGTTTGTSQLTLSDLQGAMAGLATSTPPGTPATAATVGPPLQELVTPAAITTLLENDDVSSRLLSLLPENQQSKEYLEENLRSPQVQQTLRSLTQSLLPDPDTGALDGYHSVIANFQLDPQSGDSALRTSQNPIQAFLDCIIADAAKKKKKEDSESKKEEETKEDEEMKEATTTEEEESSKKDDTDDKKKDDDDKTTPKPMEE